MLEALRSKGRTVLYRGAIDDQYGVAYSLDAPKQTYLLPAVEAMLAGRKVVVPATSAPGCELEIPATPKETAATRKTATFHGENE